MTTNIILRRRRLGRTSCREISRLSKTGIRVVRNWAEEDWPQDDIGLVIRWGCTSNIPNGRKQRVLNTTKSIHWCNNKAQSRLAMQAAGVPVPTTHPYDPYGFDGNEFLEMTEEERRAQWVARPPTHSQGRNLFVGSFNDCQETCHNWGGGYISRLINKVAEFRVFVIQNKVGWVARKTPGNPEEIAWNVARGGRFDNVRWGQWPMESVKAALHAAQLSGTDFCGVDVMEDAEGRPYILEINSAPSLTSPYRQECTSKCFDYIVLNGKEPLNNEVIIRGWRDVIHPAIIGEL